VLLKNSLNNWVSGVTGVAPSQPLLNTKDTNDLTTFLVQGTSLQNKPLQRVYHATTNGWSAIDFHQAVDNKGSGLVVALTKGGIMGGGGGTLVGGFNPLGWRSTDDYCGSNAAFLWYASGSSTGGGGIKCPILTGGNAALFDYATGGPCFGASDFILGAPRAAVMGGFAGPDLMDTRINAGNLQVGNSNLGGAYQKDQKWPVRGSFQVVQVEVYCNADIVAEEEERQRRRKSKGSGSGSSNWWPF
jgi:TLD